MGLSKPQRWRLIAVIGCTFVLAAYVARSTLDHLFWYSMLPSTRQEVTEIVLRNAPVVLPRAPVDAGYESMTSIFYVALDPTVDWDKAVAAIARPPRTVLKRAARGEIPSGARGIGIYVRPINRKRAVVWCSWTPGGESIAFTLEREWWQWKIVKEEVTTII